MIRHVVATSTIALAIALATACTVTLDAGSNPSLDAGCDDDAGSCDGGDAEHDDSSDDVTCQDGLTRCDDKCVDLQSDESNCGGCGNACSADALCVAAACKRTEAPSSCTSCPCAACASGTTCCEGSNGAPLCVEGDACP